MIVRSVVLDRRDFTTFPVFKRDWIGRPGSGERETLFQVVKARAICGHRVQQISHRGIIGAVADEDEIEQSRRVVDEVRYCAST